jgi:hypothetical protein
VPGPTERFHTDFENSNNFSEERGLLPFWPKSLKSLYKAPTKLYCKILGGWYTTLDPLVSAIVYLMVSFSNNHFSRLHHREVMSFVLLPHSYYEADGYIITKVAQRVGNFLVVQWCHNLKKPQVYNCRWDLL